MIEGYLAIAAETLEVDDVDTNPRITMSSSRKSGNRPTTHPRPPRLTIASDPPND